MTRQGRAQGQGRRQAGTLQVQASLGAEVGGIIAPAIVRGGSESGGRGSNIAGLDTVSSQNLLDTVVGWSRPEVVLRYARCRTYRVMKFLGSRVS